MTVRLSQPFQHQFALRDRLGSTRIMLKDRYFDARDGYRGPSGFFEPEVLQVNDYYPFGLNHETQVAQQSKDVQFEFTGKERIKDLGVNYNDSRDNGVQGPRCRVRWYNASLGRWVVVDPLASEFPSYTPYHYVHNNPINLVDPTGMSADTTRVFGMDGGFLGQINDNMPNQDHFVEEGSFAASVVANSSGEAGSANLEGAMVRGTSTAYIGARTRLQMAAFQASSSASNGGNEYGFALTYTDFDRQLSVQSIGVSNATTNSATFPDNAESGVSGNLLGFGHTHTLAGGARLGAELSLRGFGVPSSSSSGLADYANIGRANPSAAGHAQFIASPFGYTIYSSAANRPGLKYPRPITNSGTAIPYSGLGLIQY